MQLIYATDGPEGMSFAVAATPTALPTSAYVYAICDGASVTERVDEYAYEEMSAVEYLTFKQVVVDARRSELRRIYRVAPRVGAVRRFLQWMTGADASNRRHGVRAFGDLIGSH